MWKYQLWCEGGLLHETDYDYETEEEALEDGELARQSKFEDYETEGCEYSEDDVWVETECDE